MIVDFLAKHPVSEDSKLHKDIANKAAKFNAFFEEQTWQLFFDGVAKRDAVRVGGTDIFPQTRGVLRVLAN